MTSLSSSISGRYTKQGLWSLFLMCIFPFHLWTLILVFRDMSWIIKRTSVWDAIGNASYAMIYAFFESLVFFGILVILGLFVPKQWETGKRIAFLTVLFFTAAVWGMVSQLLYLWNVQLPLLVMRFIAGTGRPLVMLYLTSLAIILPTVILPVFIFIKSKKALPAVLDLMDRLSTLSMLYLLLDVAGLIIVVIRNIA